jgi:hypothetical protein
MQIFVINLRRRTDRRLAAKKRLDELRLKFSIIDAIDARTLVRQGMEHFVSAGDEACVRSHALAMSTFLEGEDCYALLLEDDVVLDPAIDWNALLENLGPWMTQYDFAYLQLGFVSHFYKPGGGLKGRFISLARNILNSRRERTPLLSLNLKIIGKGSEIRKVVPNESRAGAHCYVVNRNFAANVPAFNDPVWAATDAFYMYLASGDEVGSFKMGRLEVSIAEQETRFAANDSLDTDIPR